ncbi:hypothetical protein L1049_001366 [Liquidambar formosana]|uniref:TF-B3 domain-containing protein n=1 Tax=Liquidambar formosana TaxID=63359 RepID=A0AAP0NAT3_LIQFO
MEEKRARKAMAENNTTEERREIGEAALLLASLKYLRFDSRTNNALNALKNGFLGRNRANPVEENQPEIQQVNAIEVEVGENVQAPGLINFPPLPQYVLPMPGWNPPEIPPVVGLNDLIGQCSKPFEKQLTDTDVKFDQNRLSMNKIDVAKCILPLLKPEDDLGSGIPVITYDLEGNEYSMEFKIWCSKIHVLIGEWKNFLHEHRLEAIKDFVTIWAFRHAVTEKLCFVITSRRLQVNVLVKRRRTA